MGFRNVSCIFSASSIPPLLLEQLGRANVQKVYLALDCDNAGEKACGKFLQAMTRGDLEVMRVRFPEGIKDGNELLMKLGKEKAGEIFQKAMEQAVTLANKVNICPSEKKGELVVHKKGDDIEVEMENRNYRVRELDKNLSYDMLRVNLRVTMEGQFHVDTLDLYHAKQRVAFVAAASQELGVSSDKIKQDLGRLLLTLESMQDRMIQKSVQVEKPEVKMSEEDRAQALSFLQSPNLLARIVHDFAQCGLVGEETNVLVGYLSTVSRKLDDPLALIIQSLSSAGKTALLNALLKFCPPEDVVKYTAMTGQSLFYMEEKSLKHKILAISEEEGAEKATYAIKTLQSEKSLRIASTSKDPKTGRHKTNEYQVEGPAQVLLSTTNPEVDEEFQNRCLVLTINENREQTKAIHQIQREGETLSGMLRKREQEKIVQIHQNAHRLLQPLLVVNPYAQHLTFLDSKLRTRRDHVKYLTMIRAIALLHQYQRPVKKIMHRGELVQYIEVTLDDIEVANRLASEAMGISLDELAPQSRNLLKLLCQMVKERCERERIEQKQCFFTQRDVRNYTNWGHTQVKLHLARLVEMEYLVLHRASRCQQFLYELVYQGEGEKGQPFLMGLIDTISLQKQFIDIDTQTGRG